MEKKANPRSNLLGKKKYKNRILCVVHCVNYFLGISIEHTKKFLHCNFSYEVSPQPGETFFEVFKETMQTQSYHFL